MELNCKKLEVKALEMFMGYKDLLTVNDLVEILGVSKQTARREILSGKFGKPLKFGREYRVAKIMMQRYFENQSNN